MPLHLRTFAFKHIRSIGERVKAEMPQSEHLRYPRGFDRSTSLHIYAEQSGPKTLVSEDAIDRSPEHHTDGAADLCVECLPF